MTRRGRRTAIATGTIVLACFLMLTIAATTIPGGDEPAPVAEPVSLSIALRRTLPSVSHFDIIRNRPLFSATRRPSAPPPKAATAVPAPAKAVQPPVPPADTLLAVAIGPERHVAIVHLLDGRSRVLLEGDRVNGWVLAQVLPDHVVFRDGMNTAIVAFQKRQGGAFAPSFAAMAIMAAPNVRRR